MSIRDFNVTPSQFQEFLLTLDRTTVVRIELTATAPVGLMILDSDGLYEYKKRGQKSSFDVVGSLSPRSYALSPRSHIRAEIRLEAGTWYLIVEGSREPSSGRISTFP
jgi:hypothetical protein